MYCVGLVPYSMPRCPGATGNQYWHQYYNKRRRDLDALLDCLPD